MEEIQAVLESMPNFDKGPWARTKPEGLPDFRKDTPDFKKQPFHDEAAKYVAKISQDLNSGKLWNYTNPDKPSDGKQIRAVRLGKKGHVDVAFVPSGRGSLEVWDFIDQVKRGSIAPSK